MQEKKIKLLSIDMSNEMALHILPFGTGYLLDAKGKPAPGSIAAAMALQTTHLFSSTALLSDPYEN